MLQLNRELTFRSLSYLGSGVIHGDEVAKHSRAFARPNIYNEPLSLDSYICSDLILTGNGWYNREEWGRWSHFYESPALEFETNTDEEIVVFMRIRLPEGVLPAEVIASTNRNPQETIFCTKSSNLIAIHTRGPSVSIKLKILGSPHKIANDSRVLGVGYESIFVTHKVDTETRLKILEKHIV